MRRLAALIAILLAVFVPPAAAEARQSDVIANGFPATFLMPDGKKKPPVVLIIAGSGPTDRDGNLRLGIYAGYLARLAGQLAQQGIASLRYDKRGLPGSQPAPREEDLTIATFSDDAATVLSWLEARDDVGPVFLLGHSEGGLVALGVAAKYPELAGLVLVATPGRPPADLLRDQLQAGLAEPLLSQALAILATLEVGGKADNVPAPLLGLFRPSVQPFVRSLLALRPAVALGALPQPALVIGGGTDIQVSRADFDALALARAGIESRWFPKMNHVLVDTVSIRWLNALTYTNTLLPLTDGLSARIADFVDRRSGLLHH